MDPLTQLETRRVWIELPALWVQVIARFARPRSLDALEQTLLQLVALAPHTDVELSEQLGGVPVDVIGSALRSLQSMGRVHEQPGPVPRWMAPPEDAEGLDDPDLGWVALSPHREGVIPELLLDSDPNKAKGDLGGHPQIRLEKHEVSLESPERLQDLLRRAVRMGLTVLGAEQTPRVTSLRLDLELEEKGRKPAPVSRRGRVWAMLEIVPTLTGRAMLIFHEPQLAPGPSTTRPISRSLEHWIRKALPDTWRHIEAHQREVRCDQSLVLRLANIQDMGQLEALIDRHRSGWRTKLASSEDFFQGFGDELLGTLLREAHRWLILWRQRPDFLRQAIDAFGHAVERMAQVLGLQSLPQLQGWAKRWRSLKDAERSHESKRWQGEAAYVRALAPWGLQDALKSSEEHLRTALAMLKQLPERLEREQGAGSNISLWLLPLFLGTESEQQSLAMRLGQVLAREPEALTLLAELINLRNDAAHARGVVHMSPERADEHLARLLWALSAGATHSPLQP